MGMQERMAYGACAVGEIGVERETQALQHFVIAMAVCRVIDAGTYGACVAGEIGFNRETTALQRFVIATAVCRVIHAGTYGVCT